MTQQHAVLRPFGAGHAGLNVTEIELDGGGVLRIVGFGRGEEIRFCVGFHQGDGLFGAAGSPEVVESLVVDGEEAACGAVFGRHVSDRCTVRDGQCCQAGAVELDEFFYNSDVSEHLCNGEHEVCRCSAFRQTAGKFHTDDFGYEHVVGLAEHHGLCFDAADAPTEHAEAVDHSGVRIGTDAGVGKGDGLAVDFGR